MSPNLTETQKKELTKLEGKLKVSSRVGNYEEAIKITSKIQELLRPTGHETRLMESKNRLFETAMVAGKFGTASRGFIGVRKKVSSKTRLYLEATALLAICYIRSKSLSEARPYMIEALNCAKNIKSERKRKEFRIYLSKRFEDEAILASLSSDDKLNSYVDRIQEDAGLLVRQKHEDDILIQLGQSVSDSALDFIESVHVESIKQLSYDERIKLPSPKESRNTIFFGKRVFEVFQGVLWRALCDKSSEVYKLWFTNGISAVLDKKYLTTAIIGAMAEVKVGAYAIAVYVTAIIIKIGIETYCQLAKPHSVMDCR
ncbi:hypothetical protein ACH50O_14055 [Methylomonas sp. 2BW1-5-20]|uniref:hypothetical protein n=1 Tax=Methylomonas sp. 2BW1-5-20 TaxID=3376686 RepID=UPI00405096C9